MILLHKLNQLKTMKTMKTMEDNKIENSRKYNYIQLTWTK